MSKKQLKTAQKRISMQVTNLAASILMRMGQAHRRTPINGLLGPMSHHHRCDPPLLHPRLRPSINQKGSSNRGQVRYESSGVRAGELIRISMFSGSELANQARDINLRPIYRSSPCLRLYSLPRLCWATRAIAWAVCGLVAILAVALGYCHCPFRSLVG